MGYTRKKYPVSGELSTIQAIEARRKGKEIAVVVDDDDELSDAPDDVPFVREGTFRLMDLPAELRVYIYQFLMPYNKVLKFHARANYSIKTVHPITGANAWSPRWELKITSGRTLAPSITPRQKIAERQMGIGRSNQFRHDPKPCLTAPKNEIQTQLFFVNKEISKEARAVLYGSNSYEFPITSNPHNPISLQSPQIFGPFGTPERLPLLRELRSIHLEVSISDITHWVVLRQRARLEYFISVLKEHADDADQKSLLQKLTVHLGPIQRPQTFSRCGMPRAPLPTTSTIDRYMFGLESLAELQGIAEVEVTGVPEWYAKCLEVCVQGKGGEVEKTEWPDVQKKKVKKSAWGQVKRSKGVQMVSTRKWWQPVYNWVEFAERNGVETPADVGRYWADED